MWRDAHRLSERGVGRQEQSVFRCVDVKLPRPLQLIKQLAVLQRLLLDAVVVLKSVR